MREFYIWAKVWRCGATPVYDGIGILGVETPPGPRRGRRLATQRDTVPAGVDFIVVLQVVKEHV